MISSTNNQFFNRCKHNYIQVGKIECEFTGEEGKTIYPNCYFYEYEKCGKRKVLKEIDLYYRDTFLAMLDLWEKHETELDINDFIEEYKIKDATILVCGKYGITAEKYYEIAKRFLNEML